MQLILDQIAQLVGAYIPKLIGALAILIIGWLVARVVSAIVRRALRRTDLDNRLARWILGEEAAKAVEVERWTAKGMYYLIMLFVLVAFFQTLGLTIITEPLNQFLIQVFQYAPRLLGAGVLLMIAWIVASALKLIVSRALTAARIDERLGSQAGLEGRGARSSGSNTRGCHVLAGLPALLASGAECPGLGGIAAAGTGYD